MSKPRFFEFVQTSGRLGAGSFSFAVVLYVIGFREHLNDHNVRASVYAMSAVVCFCVGAYAAWSNERKRFEELQSKAARPQLAFSATAEPESRWFQFKESSVPPLFELTHLGGDAAQFIQIEPLISMHSKHVRLEFDQIRFLDAGKRGIIPSFRLLLSGQEVNPTNKVHNVGTVLFQTDAVNNPNLHTLEYPVRIKFKWRDVWQQDSVCLMWNTARQTLATAPLD